MLKGMRKNAKRILWPLTIATIIGMGGYGVWYLVRPEHPAESLVGTAWGRKIFLEEFQRAEHSSWIVAQMTGLPVNRETLVPSAWEKILLEEAAQRLEITVDRLEMADLLFSLPLFQIQGRFDRQIYQRILSRWQIGESEFEEMMHELLKIEKLKNAVRSSALTSPAEVEEFYQRVRGKVRVAYAEIDRELFRDPIPIPEADLRNLYEQNKNQFEVPPQASIQYIFIPFKDFEDKITVTADEIKQQYEENLTSFSDETNPPPELEEVRESIEAEIRKNRALQEAENLAAQIDQALEEATDLEEVAKQYSLLLQTSGYFSASGPVTGLGDAPEIVREAFSMEENQISYPISHPEGMVFFQLVDKSDSRLLPFEEAREKIKETVNQQQSDQEALKIARDEQAAIMQLMIEQKLDFEKAAEELDLKIQATSFFTSTGGEGILSSPQFVPAALLTPTGEVSRPFPTEKGYAFLHVRERAPADPMPEGEEEEWEGRAGRFKVALVYNGWFQDLIRQAQLSVTRPEFRP